MTENKLYAQCREEAIKQIEQKSSPSKAPIVTLLCKDEINQLTAEIYGMKLLETIIPVYKYNFFVQESAGYWVKHLYYKNQIEIGTTQDLHDHFVREFNVSLTNEGNNGKQ